MNDLISRKDLGAAIDNWLAIDRYYHPYSKQKTIPVSELVDIIKLLPSAQPEIVRCRECRHAFINEYHEDKPLICGLTKMCGTTDPDWFCADAERRTDERSD